MSDIEYNELDIAIVGMAGRFPDANNVEELWQNIKDGHCSVREYSDGQLRAAGVSEASLLHPDYVKRGVPFPSMGEFDAAFFGYTPREAEQLDPQQRLFLQTSWHAIEDAGLEADTRAQTAVFAGCGVPAYLLQNLLSQQQEQDITSLLALTNGNDKDSLATRVSYELDLKGPSVTVQTACSTSLVAVHMACRSLQNYECEAALAGGVWLNLNADQGYHAPAGGSLSASGTLSAFGDNADGILIGSGSATVVLKRVVDAQEAGDHILAVIKGSAINNDGKDKVGYTAPSVNGQAEVIRSALEFADVDPVSIGYIEAHGTGTVLGDPIEVAALTKAYSTEQKQFCAIGSVKANIGHLDSAAGITGLIKAVQALRHKALPPSLYAEPLNSKINFADSPFYVSTELRDWHCDTVRRAAVSSLGMGGTNAHVILEEYIQPSDELISHQSVTDDTYPWHILPLSAADNVALAQRSIALSELITRTPNQLQRIAQQLQHKCQALPIRQAFVVNDETHAVQLLSRETTGSKVKQVHVALMFSGQGSQYVTMASPLLKSVPAFKQAFDVVMALFSESLQSQLKSVFLPQDEQVLAANQLLSQTRITQPALFVVGYAMAKCYQAYGVTVSAMLGHSIGEYVAACLAGVMTLESAVKLVVARGEALQNMAPGAMLSVMSDAESLQDYLNEELDIAALNSSRNTVVAGSKEAIKALQGTLKSVQVSCTRLHVSHAFHSYLTEPALPEFSKVLAEVELNVATIPFISNVTGTWITAEQMTSRQYWLEHIRKPVNFLEGVRALSERCNVLIEAGPGDTLLKLANATMKSATDDVSVYASIAHARDLKASVPPFAKTIGLLWQQGMNINWHEMTPKPVSQSRLLPAYPFAKKQYWIEKATTTNRNVVGKSSAPQLLAPIWQQAVLSHQGAQPMWLEQKVAIICTDTPLCAQLQSVLTDSGADILSMWPSDSFEVIASRQYRVSVTDLDSLKAVNEQFGAIDLVIDCRLLAPLELDSGQYETGYEALLPVTQWVNTSSNTRLSVIASEVFNVLGNESLSPRKATVLGLTRVLALENSQTECQLIELVAQAEQADILALAKQVVMHLGQNQCGEVALRGRHAFILSEQVVTAPNAAPIETKAAVTLITGGLGGVGLALSESLIAQGHSLVLQTRSEFPDSQDWQALLTSQSEDVDDKLRTQLNTLITLQCCLKGNAKIHVVRADVLDFEGLLYAIKVAEQDCGRISHVIHAAGLAGGGLISQMSKVQAQQSMAAKIRGTENLLAIFARHTLDNMVLCSSLASVLGAFGQSDYCAANSYLDAVAQQSHAFPVQSLNWDAWQRVGMAQQHSLGEVFGISAAMGQKLLSEAMTLGLPQLYVSSMDWQQRAEKVTELTQKLLVKNVSAPEPKGHSRPDLDTEFEAPEGDLEVALAKLWGDSLGFSGIGIFDSFFELGGDSLIAIQMLAKVKQQFVIEFEPAAFFEDATIDNLAFIVESKLLEQVQTHHD